MLLFVVQPSTTLRTLWVRPMKSLNCNESLVLSLAYEGCHCITVSDTVALRAKYCGKGDIMNAYVPC